MADGLSEQPPGSFAQIEDEAAELAPLSRFNQPPMLVIQLLLGRARLKNA